MDRIEQPIALKSPEKPHTPHRQTAPVYVRDVSIPSMPLCALVPLRPRQRDILALIIRVIAVTGRSPTYAEIARHCGITKGATTQPVNRLIALGCLMRGSDRSLRPGLNAEAALAGPLWTAKDPKRAAWARARRAKAKAAATAAPHTTPRTTP